MTPIHCMQLQFKINNVICSPCSVSVEIRSGHTKQYNNNNLCCFAEQKLSTTLNCTYNSTDQLLVVGIYGQGSPLKFDPWC